MIKHVGLYLVAIATSTSIAGAKMSVKDVDAVLTKYREAEAFTATVKKTVAQEVIGTETTGVGRFFFSKGKLRLEMGEPENTTLVYDGKTVWMETRLDEKTIEVTKVKSKELKKNDSLLATLFERKNILQSFTMDKTRESGGTRIYTFRPKNIKNTEVRLLEISLSGKGQELAAISYRDDRENQVSFEFNEVVREPVPSEKFNYKPPKGANVTEI